MIGTFDMQRLYPVGPGLAIIPSCGQRLLLYFVFFPFFPLKFTENTVRIFFGGFPGDNKKAASIMRRRQVFSDMS
jgi:hypothetical protein